MITRDEALKLDRLPGNTPWESALLQHWIEENGGPYLGFDFNVHIGTALDPGSHLPDSIRRGSILNTQKRIDCVAFTRQGLYIVEGKIVVDVRVYGQFEGYRHIVERDYPDQKVLGYVVVAHASTPDTVPFLLSKGVAVYIYPTILAPGPRRPPFPPAPTP